MVSESRPSSFLLLLLLFLFLLSVVNDSVPATTRYTVPAARAARSAVCFVFAIALNDAAHFTV